MFVVWGLREVTVYLTVMLFIKDLHELPDAHLGSFQNDLQLKYAWYKYIAQFTDIFFLKLYFFLSLA